MIWIWIPVIISLGFATYKDIKTLEVPIYLFFITTAAITLIRMLMQPTYNWIDSVLGLIVCGLVYFLLALFFEGGGGDIVMMAMIGWCLGIRNALFVVMFASFIYFIWLMFTSNKKKTLPYAPGVFVGCVTTFVFNLFGMM